VIADFDQGGDAGSQAPLRKLKPSTLISSLAHSLQALRVDSRKKFVLMLGAGASISSGVKPTREIIQGLLQNHGADLSGTDTERFDKLWERSSRDIRRAFLAPLLEAHRPSVGYQHLAVLIQRGFFDLALTFNYDRLLEQALEDLGFKNYKVVTRGETELEEIARLVESPAKAFTLLKLHGSLESTDYFLFDQKEMSAYPEQLEKLVARLTARNIIVCGYGFGDACAVKAFSATGESVVSVNRSGVPDMLRGMQYNRRSQEWDLRGEEGEFDYFMSHLAQELLEPPISDVAVRNPFHFLAAYEVDQKAWFCGRKGLARKVLAALSNETTPVLHVIGPPKSGKTSFIRAGIMAELDESSCKGRYLRCRSDLDNQLRDLAHSLSPEQLAPADLQAALAALRAAAGKPLILVLDQFERVMRGASESAARRQQLVALFDALCRAACPDFRIVFVAAQTEDVQYFTFLYTKSALPVALKHAVFDDTVFEIRPLSVRAVRNIVCLLLKSSGRSFDDGIPGLLASKFGEVRERGRTFTLAHVQALCHLLVTEPRTAADMFQPHLRPQLEDALHLAINEYDILNFLEDFPAKREPHLVRRCMQVVPDIGKTEIAKLITHRFADLLLDPEFPERVS